MKGASLLGDVSSREMNLDGHVPRAGKEYTRQVVETGRLNDTHPLDYSNEFPYVSGK